MTSMTADLPLFAKPARGPGNFRAPHLAGSKSMQRALALLLTMPDGVTKADFIFKATVLSVNADVPALAHEKNGIDYTCKFERRTEAGASVWVYRLVDRAAAVVVVKRSMSPGFAGIDNPLFYGEKTSMLFADAKAALEQIAAAVKSV